ncbi:transcription-repair coupling factor [Sodalis endosymbiont of Henestaris halophilus]|uniref:transcription-repair coupling factor n=1 Tax=Sodalis endosymbiont of Henestaris halophilus TaxID=1929246 RepID=UPI000BBF56F2|nr:transcription-repair coupling factor [Sodalis endosymbiont of Henestaris halophilus]SNC58963.1 Transcription-repair-coupling factor [Sodalis endosymbiont of Henestaris halophilus]
MLKCNPYTLPTQYGQKLILGQLIEEANAVECATIVNRHLGPVLLITKDMQSALRLHNEIKKFTDHPVLILPDWGIFPYDIFSPDQKNISDRIATLYQLPTLTRGIIILSVNTLMQRVCPHAFLHRHTLFITKGQYLPREKVRAQLEQIGYRRVDQVTEHGDFAIYGALLDIYLMDGSGTYRIDFSGDYINSLYIFDIDTQRNSQEITSINMMPAHEFPTDKAGINLFCKRWREQFDVCDDTEHIYQQVIKGILPAGIEYWQPLFFSKPLVTIFSYLPIKTLVVNTGELKYSADRLWHNASKRFYNGQMDPMRRPLLPPEKLWLRVEDLFAKLKRWPWVQLSKQKLPEKAGQYNMDYRPLPDLAAKAQHNKFISKLRQFCETFDGSVIFSVESEYYRKTLSQLLTQVNILPKLIRRLDDADKKGVYLIIDTIEHGFIDATRARALICENDLLGKRASWRQQDSRITINADTIINTLEELHEGQPIIHLEHGVGRYAGTTMLEAGGIKAEYLILNYANNDKLYVPVSSLHLIRRHFSSTNENVQLHKLGGDAWARARQKAVERVRDVAAEILDIYAHRAAKNGFSFRYNRENYQLFCKDFPFELTTDQTKAINAVLSDMCQPLSMDRLVCGDVGFGKTEVAMRAAFIAIENRKQVAVLVPTTLLVQQHFDNFRKRFNKWPVRIEMISRACGVLDQNKILKHTAEGKVDILIGTHKLLKSDIKWHDLGLLVIDEEYRFGVHHKERIKAMRENIDILTLTATPIPRTLNMAMNGMRDLSIIATPPSRRMSVKTFVHEYDELIVREAIMREVLRGGQVYYLYNEVQHIEKTAERLKKLVPEASIVIGHGQLRKRDLERVMNDFRQQRFNVLVCTTIIETGIDIANANTIIIERADHFGLAQLHQLRGRVGRSHHLAYAYLLTSKTQALSKDAYKRLEAITSLENLGSGFALATQDLEIRGAGELLGEEQSGQTENIGFSLYMELLESAVNALKEGYEPSLEHLTNKVTEVDLRIPALLPEEYIPNVNMRLSLYKRIFSAVTDREVEDLKVELIERFGLLPASARYLLTIAHLRQRAQRLGIRRIEGSDKGGFIEFSATNQVDPAYLINLITHEADTYRFDGPTRLKFGCAPADYTARLNYIDMLLSKLQRHT